MRIRLSLVCVLVAGALVPAVATADPDRVPVQTVASTAGLDLSDPADAQVLYARLDKAAQAVCDSGSSRLNIRAMDRQCAEKALADAVSRAGQPQLTALYAKATGRTLSGAVMASGAQ
jgi:UrcA family protein